MFPLVDSHTHLDHFPPAEIPDVIGRAAAANVGLIICAGTTLRSSRDCVALADRYPSLYAGVGLHPTDLQGPLDNLTYQGLKELAEENPKVVCISEIGLDFQPTSPDREVQLQAFRLQIRLALELGKPIILHSRESHPEVLRTLREEGAEEVGGVMHYFQGEEDTAREAISLGFLISLAKPLLRLPQLQEVAKELPLDRIVLETDAAPQPWKKHRRNWTEPHHLTQIAEKLAELKGVPTEEVVKCTTGNIMGLLGLNQDVLEGKPSS